MIKRFNMGFSKPGSAVTLIAVCLLMGVVKLYYPPKTKSANLLNASATLSNPILSNTVSPESGSLTIAFTIPSEIPTTGDILVSIPMADDANGNDKLPDAGLTTSTSGFDLNSIGPDDISVAGCIDVDWVPTESITPGIYTTDHTIRIDRQGSYCPANSTITITIDGSPGILNPMAITSGHTQGSSDPYTINVKTRDSKDITIDEIDIIIPPIEATYVSATVEETLTFRLCGVKNNLSPFEENCFQPPKEICGQDHLDFPTTSSSVSFSNINSRNIFYNAAQYLKVSTNVKQGYKVTARESDQMAKNGVICSNENENPNCIPDTACDNKNCSHTTLSTADWSDPLNNGFGYSLDSAQDFPASWEWNLRSANCQGGSSGFCAARFADSQSKEEAVTIMSKKKEADDDALFVCYRLSVSQDQPTGYYYNKVIYTVSPTF